MVPSIFVLRTGETHGDLCWVTVPAFLMAVHFACFIWPLPQIMVEMSRRIGEKSSSGSVPGHNESEAGQWSLSTLQKLCDHPRKKFLIVSVNHRNAVP